MATTKIFPIKNNEIRSLRYIADPDKTDGGRLIRTYYCSDNPAEASQDFQDFRDLGTGKNTVLSQHFIQSFLPGEITPEKALEVGEELCRRFLKDQYQYFLAVHTDKDHIHVHCIFNNVNMDNYRTFEYLENRKDDPSYLKLIRHSDDICRERHLNVLQSFSSTKGKSHYEWEMDKKGLSWKSKLKNAIDEVVMQSEDFDDFLRKCPEHGVLVSYNPQHKIDLKFMLEEQKKNNPNARFTRARTLGWYYETPQLIRLIDSYHSRMNFVARTKIIRTKIGDSAALEQYAMRENMKETSKALNLLTKEGVTREEIQQAAQLSFIRSAALARQSDKLKSDISNMDLLIKTIKVYNKYKPVRDELRSLTGKKKSKFYEEHQDEFTKLREASDKLNEWFPNGSVPTLEMVEKKRQTFVDERAKKDEEYKTAKSEADTLGKAAQTVQDYIAHDRDVQKRKKKNDLE